MNKVLSNVFFTSKPKLENNVIVGLKIDSMVDKKAKTRIGKNAIIRSFTIIYAGTEIGDNFQTGPHVLIRENNIIGDNVVVWHNSTLNPSNIIGDGSRIHAGCFLEQVTLGKGIFVGPGVTFTNDPHPKIPPTGKCLGGARVEDGVVIGARVVVLPHIKIGKHALIGAGSVVTSDVPAFEVWAGNPAKFLKKVAKTVCQKENSLHYPYEDLLKE